jgi:hypothetical protein
MEIMKDIFICTVICILTFLVAGKSMVEAEVIVCDAVIPSGRPAMLKAVTKGSFFPEGGKVVEFFVDGKRIGRTLSGGDGYAFMKYTPPLPGIKVLKASSAGESDEGTILATKRQDRVVIVGLESSLFTYPLSFEALPEGKEAMQQLKTRFRIIYVSTTIGAKRSREWLRAEGFPVFPVLNWNGSDMLADLQEQKIEIYAVVGSPDMLSSAKRIKRKFSFEETEEATVVKDWKDLVKRLRQPR